MLLHSVRNFGPTAVVQKCMFYTISSSTQMAIRAPNMQSHARFPKVCNWGKGVLFAVIIRSLVYLYTVNTRYLEVDGTIF